MTKKTQAEKDAEKAAEREQALNEADAQFREDVAKAAEKRQKVRDKYPDGSNIAERAWNATKRDDDPEYKDSSLTHRQKLDTVVAAIRESGNADVVGLEDFEQEVLKLLAEQKIPVGTAIGPAQAEAEEAAAAEDEAADKKAAKKSGK